MKYASFVITAFIIATFAPSSNARTIFSLKDSDSITALAQFMYDVAEDVPVSTRITDNKINILDLSKCADISAGEVLSDVEKSIKRVLRFYPDEDIPFDQAIIDLEDYLDHKNYKKCLFVNKTKQSQTATSYYTDQNDKIHLRVDSVTLRSE